AGEALARRIVELMESAGLPTKLSKCGVSSGIFGVLAEEAGQQWTGKFNPRPVSEADLLALYEAALWAPRAVSDALKKRGDRTLLRSVANRIEFPLQRIASMTSRLRVLLGLLILPVLCFAAPVLVGGHKTEWRLFRGNPEQTGVAVAKLP